MRLRMWTLTLIGVLAPACEDSVGTAQSPIVEGNAPNTSPCDGIDLTKINESARTFMKKNGLIKEGDESEGKVATRWSAVALRPASERCLVVMNDVLSAFGKSQLGTSYEVIAVSKADTQVKFALFEEVTNIPSSMRVAIGAQNNVVIDAEHDNSSFYYAELTGESLVAVLKSRDARLRYNGFGSDLSATIEKVNGETVITADGKAAFDPTPERTWKLKNSSYSLRRGATPEINDVQPFQLDAPGAFAGVYKGCDGHVASWRFSSLRKILGSDGKWSEVAKTESISLH